MLKKLIAIVVTIVFISGCTQEKQQPTYYKNPDYDKPHTPAVPVTNLTLGKIQKHIYRGMSEYEVISILGAPNIVTGNSDRSDSWIYEKQFSTITKAEGKVIFTGPMGDVSFDSSATSPNVVQQIITQKSLTLIIDFDVHQRVSKFAYHYSTF